MLNHPNSEVFRVLRQENSSHNSISLVQEAENVSDQSFQSH